MPTYWWVSGELLEVQRYINVPMRWCEQYPARERRELWIATMKGREVKIIIHGRYLPARRGHHVSVLLLGNLSVGLFNRSTGDGINFVRTDPPLLWRRCDATIIVVVTVLCLVGYVLSSWPWLLASMPAAVLHGVGTFGFRVLWRWMVRVRVDRILDREASVINARSKLRRVK